jgi:4-hydroxybenzoate polyprenyltransferase
MMRCVWLRITLRALKAIGYRVLSVLVQIAFVYAVTRNWTWTVLLIPLNVVLVLLYMGYDRLWEWILNHHVGIRYNYPRVPLRAKLKAVIANARPYTLILPVFGGWFIIQASLGRMMIPTPDMALTAVALLSMMLINAAGNYWNSIYDVEIDRVNKPYRPLPSGLLTPREARAIALVLTAGALMAALAVNPIFFALATAGMAMTFFYSAPPVRFKARLWVNNIAQALIRGVLGPLTVWTVYARITPDVLALTSVVFLLIVTGQSVKDIPDMKGDAAFGIRTIPVVYGVPVCNRIVAVGAVASGVLAAIWSTLGVLPWSTLLLYTPLAAALVYFTLRPKETVTENQMSWTVFYLTMVFTMLGFALGRWGFLP